MSGDSAFWTWSGSRNRWPSGVTMNRPLLMTPGNSNTVCGTPTSRLEPRLASTAMILPSGALKKSSLPSLRQKAEFPPFAET